VLITKSEEYGVRLVMRMAREGGQLSVTQLAEMERLPETTVAKVLLQLRKAGLVRAERGRNGGYVLAEAPARISMARVLQALGEPLFSGRFCQAEIACACPNDAACGLRSVWAHIDRMIEKVLAGTTVEDLLAREDAVDRHVRSLWPIETDSGTAREPEPVNVSGSEVVG